MGLALNKNPSGCPSAGDQRCLGETAIEVSNYVDAERRRPVAVVVWFVDGNVLNRTGEHTRPKNNHVESSFGGEKGEIFVRLLARVDL